MPLHKMNDLPVVEYQRRGLRLTQGVFLLGLRELALMISFTNKEMIDGPFSSSCLATAFWTGVACGIVPVRTNTVGIGIQTGSGIYVLPPAPLWH
jgi:hypothetical protein